MDKRLRWLNNLLCFEVAARHQSYSKAAEELYISQAAVSQQMRQLESNLGVSLFRRQSRKMLLTGPGRTLYASCEKGFSEIVSGLNQVHEEPLEGSLTVTSTQAFCALWLMPNLFEFFNQYPTININIQASNRIESLHKGDIDIAIRFSTSSTAAKDDSLIVQRFGENGVVPACSPEFQTQMQLHSVKDMLGARLLALAGEEKASWEAYFEHSKINLSNKILRKTVVSSSDLAVSAALAGQGVMLASDVMIGQYLKSGQLVVPIDIPHPVRWKSHFVYLKNSPKQQRIAHFCEWLTEKMANHEALQT
ncbi:LysR family transcriptional regulator [Alteromonas sp. K632G]|jgi:LysR family glycine cleavage system transcriptional activator|uniref:LysR substrate-binding domain-containing protein n=1 Tax=Alteromonas sp. K632G TaxID=2820757 RepID=UPI001AD77063|nr:LysR substrate-binding domain-containing protein [Alteromonas sp. K632G]MBO7924469.1 LysR family transcriptional regulator [Alteromonas sp. K632G]